MGVNITDDRNYLSRAYSGDGYDMATFHSKLLIVDNYEF